MLFILFSKFIPRIMKLKSSKKLKSQVECAKFYPISVWSV